MSLRRPVALAATSLFAVPAALAPHAGAAGTTTIDYQCKYPLIGVKTLSIKLDLDVPATWPTGTPTEPFAVAAEASAFGMGPGLQAIDGLTAVKGTATAFVEVTTSGPSRRVNVVTRIPETVLPVPLPDPLVLPASGTAPRITINTPGRNGIYLTKLSINLTALDAAGDPIALPPVTKDLDGNAVSDSDGDPNTFDVYCKIPGNATPLVGEFQTVGPIRTPGPTETPDPTVPTPTPAPTQTPEPTPTSSPVPPIPADAVTEPFQCKWPLLGVRSAAVSLKLGAATGSEPVPFELWFDGDHGGGLELVDDLDRIGGTIETTLAGTPTSLTATATVDAFARDYARNSVLLHATGTLPPHEDWTPNGVLEIAPNLIAYDSAGAPIVLPPLTKNIQGEPFTQPDDDVSTFALSCAKGDTPPPTITPTPGPATPTPGPTTPTPTPGPVTATPTPNPDGQGLELDAKWPLIGIKPARAKVVAGLPASVDPGEPIPITLNATFTADDLQAGFEAIDDLTTVEGTIDVRLRISGGGLSTTKLVKVPVGALDVSGHPNTVVLAGDGVTTQLPAPSQAGGTVTVEIASIGLNLLARDSAGEPVVLPPVIRDFGGEPLVASDDDSNTFDVITRYRSGDPTLGTTTVRGSGGPTPTPAPATPTPTAAPKTPLPGPVTPSPTGDGLEAQVKWPLLGIKPATVKVAASLPTSVVKGEPIPIALRSSVQVRELGAGLASIDEDRTARLDGQLLLGLKVKRGTVETTEQLTLPITPTTYDGFSDAITLPAVGSVTIPGATAEGQGVTVSLASVTLSLRALDQSGNVIVLPPVTRDLDGASHADSDGNPETFDVLAKITAGQDLTLGSTVARFDGNGLPTPTPVRVTPTPSPVFGTPSPSPTPPVIVPTARFSYTLQGSTKLGTLTKGTLPLTGSVDAQLAIDSGAVTAALTLNDTQGRLTTLGFLPVTATIGFVTSGATTGKLVDDALTTNSRVRVKVKSVKAFGAIPLVSGNTCQTKSLSDVTLTSADAFDPTGTGGTLAGTYAISDLNGCGPLGGLVSPLTAGSGNAISVKLTPKP